MRLVDATKKMRSVLERVSVAPFGQTEGVNRPGDDPVPAKLLLNLDEAFRVLETLEDARLAMRDARLGPGLQDEMATVIRMIHGRLGLEEGGVL